MGLKARPADSAERTTAAAPSPVDSDGRLRRSPALQKLVEVGREVLGIQDLRPGQGEALEHILAGNNLLAVMPTGSGKSLLYQLPSLVLPGITVVVSPLLALIKDQVDKMKKRGVAVVRIDSSLTTRQERAMLALAAAPGGKLLLTTPERMAQPEFRELLKSASDNVGVSLFVVDEAHCVSHWGHDFRPSYLDIRKALDDLGNPQVLATTATAPPHVRDDILHQLGMPDAEQVTTTFDRPNLHYECIALPGDDEKQQTLVALLKRLPKPGIVYCATVRAVNALHESALRHGIKAVKYHGRLTKKERDASQTEFMEPGSDLIMFATNAFGLGVDKSDVRYVLHYHVPGSLEAYAQEAGRAGRDGKPSRCVLLFSPDDVAIQEYFLKGTYPTRRQVRGVVNALEVWDEGRDKDDDAARPTLKNVALASKVGVPRTRTVLSLLKDEGFVTEDEDGIWALSDPPPDPALLQQKAKQYEARRIADRRRLDALLDYVRAPGCRNQVVLDYLGEPGAPECGRCDNCLRSAEAAEAAAREATALEETVTDRLRADDGELDSADKPRRVIRHRIISLDEPKPEPAADGTSAAGSEAAADKKAARPTKDGAAAKSSEKAARPTPEPEAPLAVADNEEIQRLIAEQQEAHAAQQAGLIGEEQWEYIDDDDDDEEDENYEYETVVEEYEVIDKTAAALAEEDYVDPDNAEITILKRKHVPKPKGKKKQAAPEPAPVKKKRRRRRRRRKAALPKGAAFSSPVLTAADQPKRNEGPKTEVRRSRRGAKADAGGPLLVEYVRGSMRINSAPVASATPNDSPPGRKKKRRKPPGGAPRPRPAAAAKPAPHAPHPAVNGAAANGASNGGSGEAGGEPAKKKRRRRRRRKKGQNGATSEAEGPITFFSTGSSPTPTGVQPGGSSNSGKKKRRRRRRRGRKSGSSDQSSPGSASE